jgi:hypothetical protein
MGYGTDRYQQRLEPNDHVQAESRAVLRGRDLVN